MDLQFTCRKCGGETSAELAELADDPVLVCEDCGYEADPTLVADVAATIDEMLASAARLARSFTLAFELGAEELPAAALEAEEEEEEEEL